MALKKSCNNMEYKASLDTLAKAITIGVVILFIVIGQENVRALLDANGDMNIILIHSSLLLLFVIVLIVSWIYAPQSYSVDPTDLTINRPVGKVKIRLSDITQVRSIENNEMKGTIRTFGVGGLFGYYGKYYIPSIGSTTFYTTQRRNKILLTTQQDKKIVLTPDNLSLIEKIKPQRHYSN